MAKGALRKVKPAIAVKAIPSGVRFEGTDLVGARFQDARLMACTIQGSDLSSARIFDTDLTGAVISGCRTDEMTIDGIRVADLLDAYAQLQQMGWDDEAV